MALRRRDAVRIFFSRRGLSSGSVVAPQHFHCVAAHSRRWQRRLWLVSLASGGFELVAQGIRHAISLQAQVERPGVEFHRKARRPCAGRRDWGRGPRSPESHQARLRPNNFSFSPIKSRITGSAAQARRSAACFSVSGTPVRMNAGMSVSALIASIGWQARPTSNSGLGAASGAAGSPCWLSGAGAATASPVSILLACVRRPPACGATSG